jgi:hypothetical protein
VDGRLTEVQLGHDSASRGQADQIGAQLPESRRSGLVVAEARRTPLPLQLRREAVEREREDA